MVVVAAVLCVFVPWTLVLSHCGCIVLGYALWRLGRRPAVAELAPVHAATLTEWDRWLNRQPHAQQVLRDLVGLAQQRVGLSLWNLDLTTGVYACDDNMRRMLGISGEMTLSIATQCVHPEDRALVNADLKRLLKDRGSDDLLRLRHRTLKPDGTVSHIETYGRVVRTASGWATRIQGITRDVTAEVEHVEQLEQQARHVQVLLDRISVAVKAAGIAAWELDLATRQFLWVENLGSKMGLNDVPAEQAAEALLRVMDPGDLAESHKIAQAAIASGQPTYSYRFRIRRNANTVRYMQAYVHIVRNEAGRAVRMIGATADITNEVQTNELLQRQAEQGQALLERLTMATRAAGIGFWEMDLQRQALSIHDLHDPTALEDCEPNPLAVLQALQHPADRDALTGAVDDALHAGSDVVSYRYRARDGEGWAHKQNYARLILDGDGRALRALGLTWDVTKEVVAAERLAQQVRHERTLLDRLSLVTQTANISSWEIDLATQQFLWSDNLITAFCRPDGCPGTVAEFTDRIHPEDRPRFDSELHQVLKSGGAMLTSRHRLLGPNGEEVHVQTHFRLTYDAGGRPARLLGVAWDVSNEVAATAKVQQQAEEGRVLSERLSMATQAADIRTWELDLVTGKFLWFGKPVAARNVIVAGSTIEAFAERVHSEDREVLTCALRDAIKTGKEKIEYRYRTIDGGGERPLHWQVHAQLYRSEAGRVTRMLAVTREITSEVEVAARLEAQAKHERVLLERFSMATQTANICSWEVDLRARRFLWADNPIKTVNGVQDLTGGLDTFAKRVHPEDLVRQAILLREAIIKGTGILAWCYRDIGPSGETAHIQTHARIAYDEAGVPLTMLGVSWDVTPAFQAAEKLKQQAQQLHDAQRRLERASLSSSEGHWESDMAQQRLWFSSSYHTLLGYREGELSTHIAALDDLVHPDDLPAIRLAHQEHLEQGTSFCVDARMRTASGEYRWFRQRGTAERNAQGQATSMSGSIQDIHQQKLAENALDLAQQRLERAINGTQDGLWELESGGAAWCSPRVAELLGYAADELPSDSDFLHLFLHPDDTKVLADATEMHFEHDLPYEAEIRLRTKQGEYRWYRARAAAERNALRQPQRLSGSLQDVTEARAAREALLRATEAAQAASQAKSEFLANVSHEIRTPMNGIIGMTRLLLDTTLDRTQRDYAGTIRGSADSLLVVINDILDFSKIEAGKLEIESIEFDLAASVEEVAATMAMQAALKQLELVVDIDPEIPTRALGDPQRVRQCLLNLLGNAVKFTQSGEVVIEVRSVLREGRMLAHFEVRDTGIGIAAPTLETLFQPFVQADSSTTRHFGGTGLGLSIVRRLVEMMGGEVGVASELGQGSRFWFRLPLFANGAAPRREVDLARLGRRVLLAEGNATLQRVLAAQLLHAGYEIELASSGSDVIARLLEGARLQRPFEVLLADLHLAGLDGQALLARVSAEPSLQGCRVVLLARFGQADLLADTAAFAGCLNKPVRNHELLKCLQRAVDHRSGDWHLQTQSLFKRAAAASSVNLAGRVLLVEDNIVNQKVAVRFLERLGCEVSVADNGVNGVKAYREGHFDLVLMDLQMPIMDGLTATRCIREIEAHGPRIPIVALTANAMPGQQQVCAEAGMDGFLTKPIDLTRLQETLVKHGFDKSASTAVEPVCNSPQVQPALEPSGLAMATIQPACVDLTKLRELTEGDVQFTQELTETFATSGTQIMRELQTALAAGDRTSLGRAAHKLKGAAANVHAGQLAGLADRLETQANTAEPAAASVLIEQLNNEFLRAVRFLEQQVSADLARAG